MTPGAGSAVEFVAPREVEVVAIDPSQPGPQEVRVESILSAVSAGTERLVYCGDLDPTTATDTELPALNGDLSYPLRYGYAVVGTVTAVGDAVDPAWNGRTVFGFNPHESQFLAEPENLYPVPDDLSPAVASLFANTETAVNFTLDAAPRIGERIAVFGQGVVGLLTTALLARSSAETVIAVEPCEHRRKTAAALGADQTIDPTAVDAASAINDRTEGVDIAVEVSGRPETLETAVEVTRFGGEVLAGSWYGTKRAELGFGDHFHRNRVSITSSQVSTIAPELRGRWDHERRRETTWRALRRLTADVELEDHLVTDRVSVSEAPSVYRRLTAAPDATLQVLFTY